MYALGVLRVLRGLHVRFCECLWICLPMSYVLRALHVLQTNWEEYGYPQQHGYPYELRYEYEPRYEYRPMKTDPDMPSSSGSLPYGSDRYKYRPPDYPPPPTYPPPQASPVFSAFCAFHTFPFWCLSDCL